jgi:hypothetical protein
MLRFDPGTLVPAQAKLEAGLSALQVTLGAERGQGYRSA